MAEWLVALEVTPGRWDGGLSDIAQHLQAVGEIRAEPGTGRYSLLVRRHEDDPAEALQAAIAAWQEARFRSGEVDARLVAAKVVVLPDGKSSAGEVEGAGAPPRLSRRARVSNAATVLSRPVAIAGGALLLILVVVAVAGLGSSRGGAARRPTVAVPAASQNLLTEGSMESPTGFGHQFRLWGSAHTSFVATPVADGHRAVRVEVAPGQTGGFWAELPVQPATSYEESAAIQVVDLAPSSRLEMTLEWYDAAHQLLGYRMVGVPAGDPSLVRRVQQVVAPGGATTARLAVNVTHGGSYVVDDERLEPVAAAASAGR